MRLRRGSFILAAGLAGLFTATLQAHALAPNGYTAFGKTTLAGGFAVPEDADSLDECRDECKASCKGVVWNATSGTCKTIVTLDGFQYSSQDAVYLATPVSEIPKIKALSTTRYQGYDAPGHDIKRHDGVRSEMMCRTLCASNDECAAYTWRDSDDRCWLKKHVPRLVKRGGLVSGYVAWDVPTASLKKSVTFPETKLSGHRLRRFNTQKRNDAAVAACQSSCESDHRCESATVTRHTGMCELFSDFDRESFNPTGNRLDPTAIIKFDFRQGRRYAALRRIDLACHDQPGNDIGHAEADTFTTCQALCAQDVDCVAATWNWGSKDCFLKHTARVPVKTTGSCNSTTTWVPGFPS